MLDKYQNKINEYIFSFVAWIKNTLWPSIQNRWFEVYKLERDLATLASAKIKNASKFTLNLIGIMKETRNRKIIFVFTSGRKTGKQSLHGEIWWILVFKKNEALMKRLFNMRDLIIISITIRIYEPVRIDFNRTPSILPLSSVASFENRSLTERHGWG